MTIVLVIVLVVVLVLVRSVIAGAAPVAGRTEVIMEKIRKSDAEWAKQLTPDEYQITRGRGTEPAFTGKYHGNEDAGHLPLRVPR